MNRDRRGEGPTAAEGAVWSRTPGAMLLPKLHGPWPLRSGEKAPAFAAEQEKKKDGSADARRRCASRSIRFGREAAETRVISEKRQVDRETTSKSAGAMLRRSRSHAGAFVRGSMKIPAGKQLLRLLPRVPGDGAEAATYGPLRLICAPVIGLKEHRAAKAHQQR